MMAEVRRHGNHYVNARTRELEVLRTEGQFGVLGEMRDTIGRYKDDLLLEIGHLMKWYDVLAPVKTG